jgi:hypothetical protein
MSDNCSQHEKEEEVNERLCGKRDVESHFPDSKISIVSLVNKGHRLTYASSNSLAASGIHGT